MTLRLVHPTRTFVAKDYLFLREVHEKGNKKYFLTIRDINV
jgi:hypothetical protein